jgi:hypothetical protein
MLAGWDPSRITVQEFRRLSGQVTQTIRNARQTPYGVL